MNVMQRNNRSENCKQSIMQGGNSVNLISMIKINNDRKEHRTSEPLLRNESKSDYGCSIYESLEYVKSNLGENSLKLQMELIKNLVR